MPANLFIANGNHKLRKFQIAFEDFSQLAQIFRLNVFYRFLEVNYVEVKQFKVN